MSSPPPHPIVPGTVLAGKYRIQRIIGQGGMGVVAEAWHLALDERVALKFLLPEYAGHPEAAPRFLREARAAVKIKSPHVARVSDVGTLDTGAPYMVMEYLEGSDASVLLEQQGVLPVPDAVDLIVQASEAIAEAHSYGIVHRDLKPANLFVTRHSDGAPFVKVLDFGISKVTRPDGIDNLTRTTTAMGSALYMSPEQMQQARSVDSRTDIYALGVALYELLAGKQPYFADTLPQLCAEILTGTPTPLQSLRPDVPAPLAAVIEKAYARDRGMRFQSVAEFVVALAPFAPPRSQPNIDRVARTAGLTPPRAGARPSSAPPRDGGTHARGTDGRAARPVLIETYAAPASAKAAAAFAQGSSTDLSAATTTARPAGKTGLVVGLVALGAGAAIAFFVLRDRGGARPIPAAASEPAATSATPPATAPDLSAEAIAPPESPPAASAASAAPLAPVERSPAVPRPGANPGKPVKSASLAATPPPAPSAAPAAKPTAPPPAAPTMRPDDYR